jgi:hypothetical protein
MTVVNNVLMSNFAAQLKALSDTHGEIKEE